MKNKITRVLCCIFAVMIVAGALLSFTGCEDGEIYKLVEALTGGDGKSEYTFEANVNMILDIEKLKNKGNIYAFQETLDVVPNEVEFVIKGSVAQSPLLIEAEIAIKDYEEAVTKIYVKDGELFFELNEFSRIIVDVLWATGIIDEVEMVLFTEKITFDSDSILCFDITEFELSDLKKYITNSQAVLEVDSTVKYGDGKDFTVADYEKSDVLYFKDMQEQIKKELLAVPGYRYVQLTCVISTEDGINYIDTVASKESGELVQLDRVKIDCDLSTVRKNPNLFPTAEIIPLRYIFELLGKEVRWDADTKTAYVSNLFEDDEELQCNGKLIKSKMYMAIENVESFDYSYEVRDVGEYIEFVIFANDID